MGKSSQIYQGAYSGRVYGKDDPFLYMGALPDALQDVNKKIFSEWLPSLQDYEFAAGYCVEMYDAPDKYPNGTYDQNYYTEIWLPVKKK